MTVNGWLQIGAFLAVVFALTPVLGRFMTRCSGANGHGSIGAGPARARDLRLTGVDAAREMRWTEYAIAMLAFSVVSMLMLYGLQRVQAWLPLNPQALPNVPPVVAFNTAASFTTNTNWQAYSGESTMSYLTQMAGLAYHNFMSAAVGIALAIAFIRGIAQEKKDSLGNFWVDLVRASLWVLLPCASPARSSSSHRGCRRISAPTTVATAVDRGVTTAQTIAQGPVASQEIIKEFGTNGGGFFNANSAHPFENPTPLTNFIQLVAIFAISAGLTYTLGQMTGSRAHGWAVWGAMAALFLAGMTVAYWAEARGNPMLPAGGNMEGKGRALRHREFGALCDGDDRRQLRRRERDARFVHAARRARPARQHHARRSDLRRRWRRHVRHPDLRRPQRVHRRPDGRTHPEYLGKKIQAYDVQMAMLVVLVFPLTILTLTAISAVSPPSGRRAFSIRVRMAVGDPLCLHLGHRQQRLCVRRVLGEHELVQHHHRRGDADRPLLMIIPMLAVAGNLGRKKAAPPSQGPSRSRRRSSPRFSSASSSSSAR
jgi:K+-transporting ATPase ATPase A chain